jgi:hypothetical protein
MSGDEFIEADTAERAPLPPPASPAEPVPPFRSIPGWSRVIQCSITIARASAGLKIVCKCQYSNEYLDLWDRFASMSISILGCRLIRNGIALATFRFPMGESRCEDTPYGLDIVWSSADADVLGMLEAAGDYLSALQASGCRCILYLDDQPVCSDVGTQVPTPKRDPEALDISAAAPLAPYASTKRDILRAPRGRIRFDAIEGGLAIACTAEDPGELAAARRQWNRRAWGTLGFALIRNGFVLADCHLPMGQWKDESTDEALRCAVTSAEPGAPLEASAHFAGILRGHGCGCALLLDDRALCVDPGPSGAGTDPRPDVPVGTVTGFVHYFHGESARCLVDLDGRTIPVDLPADVLRSHGLHENRRFAWDMSSEAVRPRDIRPLPPPEQSDHEREELDRLDEEDRREEMPDIWERLRREDD